MSDMTFVKRLVPVIVLAVGLSALILITDRQAVPHASLPAPTSDSCDAAYAVERGQSEDQVDQAVVCLLIPECFRNSDCDAECGVRLGRCVHNDCPARICRCR